MKMKHKQGSTMYLLYWQKEWAKRFFVTWYHIFNRKAYWNFRLSRKGVPTDADLDFILRDRNDE